MALIDNLRRLLREAFPGAVPKLAKFSGGRVGGTLVWEGFDGQLQIDRQLRLREALDALPTHDQVMVSFILTVTPEELSVMTTP